MALIELTPDDLCAMVSSPFPCEEGTIIDPVAVAHFLGFVETSAATLEPVSDESLSPDVLTPDPAAGRSADRRLAMLSLACSMEASQAVTRARALRGTETEGASERAGVKQSLDAFTDGALASPPVLTTVIPPAGSVVVVGTVIVTIPTPPPVPPHWSEGEQLARTDLLAMAARFQSASKMPGVGATAEDLAAAASRLFDAAVAR